MTEGSVLTTDYAERAITIRRTIEALFPTEGMLLRNCLVPDESLVKSVESAKVHYATGGSDAESVRDYDNGLGPVRFHRRDAYSYRREENVEGQTYRRRCAPESVHPSEPRCILHILRCSRSERAPRPS